MKLVPFEPFRRLYSAFVRASVVFEGLTLSCLRWSSVRPLSRSTSSSPSLAATELWFFKFK